ncbi:fumarate/nitrate reduction transcriptional regulator Fnr [Thiorhodospira sibirica]|uniref:fumarate/nitrate reduction transcriptional regulator Fnr n=1 Tax=Thiorhodospira sibirica TaxID=154347 RepID=UPI00022C52DF|nr:fumarate/nitrate reduction transcriptional regulator Fnr [Thiorhodospira sibirica]
MNNSPNVVDLKVLKQACKNCGLSDLCLPLGVSAEELEALERIIDRKRPLQRNEHLYVAGDRMTSLYAVRSGSVKTYTVTNDGQEQITGFHLPGELLGLDAINGGLHPCSAKALETTSICEMPFEALEEVSQRIPALQHQLFRIMSREIQADEHFMMLLGKKSSDARLAFFLLSLSTRLGARGFSHKEFYLTMSRNDIANYLGLAVETVSRLFTRFQNAGIVHVRRKLVTIERLEPLRQIAGVHRIQERCQPENQDLPPLQPPLI